MLDTARQIYGVGRSLAIYYGSPRRRRAMDALYGRFVGAGSLAFDIGAHVGDRIASFRRLGARVVAVEPQPHLARTLRLLYGREQQVAIVDSAVGATAGRVELHLNLANPTVSTASDAFVGAAAGAPGWEGQTWSRSGSVPMTTLDALIATHGRPDFIKIDVEGFEADVLVGLSEPVPVLSFEFTTIQRDVAHDCLARCAALGAAGYNAALGESQQMIHGDWQSAAAIAAWLDGLPQAANSGDIYVRFEVQVTNS